MRLSQLIEVISGRPVPLNDIATLVWMCMEYDYEKP